MADVRKSGKQTAARQRAREKAAEFREKQDKLEQLATDYFVLADSIEEIEANVEKEITAARQRGDKLSREAHTKADGVIVSMLDLGAPRNEVAGRLGISTRDVKRPASTPTVSPAPPSDGSEVDERSEVPASE